jgi:hypothetical protein
MSGIAYELVPEANAPDELQPGVSRYVEQPDGTILQYIGDEDGNPVLVSGRSQVLFAADLHIEKDSSNSQTVFCDALGLTNVEYRYSEPDYYYGSVEFENAFPNNPDKVKARGQHSRNSELFSMQYQFRESDYSAYSNGSEISIYAYEEGVDDSLIIDPGSFRVYVELIQF